MRNLFLVFSFFVVAMGYAQNDLKWNYSIIPGTDEWECFTTRSEMVDACNIPDSVLVNIPTDQLTILCLNYPLIMDIFAYNSLADGFENYFLNFNGIQELVKRKDALSSLSSLYEKSISQVDSMLKGKSSEYKFDYVMKISFLEMILGSEHLLDRLTNEQQKDILSKLQSAYVTKYSYLNDFKYYGFACNVFARTHLLKKIVGEDVVEKSFSDIDKGVIIDAELVKELDKLSQQIVFDFNKNK